MTDTPLDVAVFCDAPEENWPSMDLAAEMLLAQWAGDASVRAARIEVHVPRLARRLPRAPARAAFNLDRAFARYVAYPAAALAARRPGRHYHVVDHTYAALLHALPGARSGVYCHDLDAFDPIFHPERPRSAAYPPALARLVLEGMRRASVVFHSTRAVGTALEAIVRNSRLVHAPYGIAEEFREGPEAPEAAAEAARVLAPLRGQPFLLHVGSGIPRKRLDLLFEVFARVRAARPDVHLVQQGARLSDAQRALVERLGIAPFLVQPPKLDRPALAALYRRAALVLLPSDAEGFGLPVLEALACGAPVLASDLPTLREAGGTATLYAPPGDVDAWSAAAIALLGGARRPPPPEVRAAHAASFTWTAHARTIADAYRGL